MSGLHEVRRNYRKVVLVPLLLFLADTKGEGWSGNAADLGPALSNHCDERTWRSLPDNEVTWVSVLRFIRPALRDRGWHIRPRSIEVGEPVTIGRKSFRPLASADH